MSLPPSDKSKNPYEPPKASLAEVMAESHHHERFRWTAALAGFATDIGATLVGGCVIGVVAGFVLAAQGLPQEEIQRQAATGLTVNLVSLAYGLLCTALGGFVAAWVAGFKPVQHALAAGGISLAFGVVTMALIVFLGFGGPPLWISLLGLILILPAAALGGVLRGGRG